MTSHGSDGGLTTVTTLGGFSHAAAARLCGDRERSAFDHMFFSSPLPFAVPSVAAAQTAQAVDTSQQPLPPAFPSTSSCPAVDASKQAHPTAFPSTAACDAIGQAAAAAANKRLCLSQAQANGASPSKLISQPPSLPCSLLNASSIAPGAPSLPVERPLPPSPPRWAAHQARSNRWGQRGLLTADGDATNTLHPPGSANSTPLLLIATLASGGTRHRTAGGGTRHYMGVRRDPSSGKWDASLWLNDSRRVRRIGRYDTAEAAARAYDAVALRLYGAAALLNFAGDQAAQKGWPTHAQKAAGVDGRRVSERMPTTAANGPTLAAAANGLQPRPFAPRPLTAAQHDAVGSRSTPRRSYAPRPLNKEPAGVALAASMPDSALLLQPHPPQGPMTSAGVAAGAGAAAASAASAATAFGAIAGAAAPHHNISETATSPTNNAPQATSSEQPQGNCSHHLYPDGPARHVASKTAGTRPHALQAYAKQLQAIRARLPPGSPPPPPSPIHSHAQQQQQQHPPSRLGRPAAAGLAADGAAPQDTSTSPVSTHPPSLPSQQVPSTQPPPAPLPSPHQPPPQPAPASGQPPNGSIVDDDVIIIISDSESGSDGDDACPRRAAGEGVGSSGSGLPSSGGRDGGLGGSAGGDDGSGSVRGEGGVDDHAVKHRDGDAGSSGAGRGAGGADGGDRSEQVPLQVKAAVAPPRPSRLRRVAYANDVAAQQSADNSASLYDWDEAQVSQQQQPAVAATGEMNNRRRIQASMHVRRSLAHARSGGSSAAGSSRGRALAAVVAATKAQALNSSSAPGRRGGAAAAERLPNQSASPGLATVTAAEQRPASSAMAVKVPVQVHPDERVVVLGQEMAAYTAAAFKVLKARALQALSAEERGMQLDAAPACKLVVEVIPHEKVEDRNDLLLMQMARQLAAAVALKLQLKGAPTVQQVFEHLPASGCIAEHLLSVYAVGDDDPRVALRGECGMHALPDVTVPALTLLAPYSGHMMFQFEYEALCAAPPSESPEFNPASRSAIATYRYELERLHRMGACRRAPPSDRACQQPDQEDLAAQLERHRRDLECLLWTHDLERYAIDLNKCANPWYSAEDDDAAPQSTHARSGLPPPSAFFGSECEDDVERDTTFDLVTSAFVGGNRFADSINDPSLDPMPAGLPAATASDPTHGHMVAGGENVAVVNFRICGWCFPWVVSIKPFTCDARYSYGACFWNQCRINLEKIKHKKQLIQASEELLRKRAEFQALDQEHAALREQLTALKRSVGT